MHLVKSVFKQVIIKEILINLFDFQKSVKEKLLQERQKYDEERRSSRKQGYTNDSGNEASSEDSNDSEKSARNSGMFCLRLNLLN